MRAILTYHSIDDSGSVISVSRGDFRRHAEWLATAAAPRAVTVDEAVRADDAEDCLALVFDDAFENFETAAWPVLRDLGIPATLFVVSREVGRTNAWGGEHDPEAPTLRLLDWDALGRLAGEGVEIGSHTRTHRRLEGLDRARLVDEIEGSAEDIETRLGERPEGFAYPYGSLDDAAEAVVSSTYGWGCTTELAVLERTSPPHRLPRLDAYYYRRPGQLESWATPTFRARLGVRRAARDARAWLDGRRAS